MEAASEEELLNDPQPEDEDSDCIYYEPAPHTEDDVLDSEEDAVREDETPDSEKDAIGEDEFVSESEEGEDEEDELEEGEIDEDEGEETQLNDGFSVAPGPVKRGRSRHCAPEVLPTVEESRVPAAEEEEDDDDEPIFLEIRPSPLIPSGSVASQHRNPTQEEPPIIVASLPEEEEEEEPSQQSQRNDASPSTQSSVGPEPPVFEGPADLTWAEDGGAPAMVPAVVRITRGDDSKCEFSFFDSLGFDSSSSLTRFSLLSTTGRSSGVSSRRYRRRFQLLRGRSSLCCSRRGELRVFLGSFSQLSRTDLPSLYLTGPPHYHLDS